MNNTGSRIMLMDIKVTHESKSERTSNTFNVYLFAW